MLSSTIRTKFSPTADLVFSVLCEADIDEAAQCVATTFSESNPITKIMQISAEEFIVYSLYICKTAAKAGLSLVAREKQTGKFVGCRLVEDLNAQHDDMPVLSPSFDPIFALLSAASSHLPILDKPIKVAHFATLSVYKEYQGMGVAKKLLALQLHFLSQVNYEYFQVELVHPHTQQAIVSILDTPAEFKHQIKYVDFEYKQSKPFEKLPGELIVCLNKTDSLKPEFKIWASKQNIEGFLQKEVKLQVEFSK